MDLTTEELIELISKDGKPKEKKKFKRKNKDVVDFIKKNYIKPGKSRYPTYIIYYHFIKWAKNIGRTIWGKEEFFRTFKQYFDQRRTGKQRYYLLNDKLELTEELIEKAKKYENKFQKTKRSIS